jgi:hypothetical protein
MPSRKHTPELEGCLWDAPPRGSSELLDRAFARARLLCIFGAREASGVVADRVAWDLLRRTSDADHVLLDVCTAVGPGWHEVMRDAAYEDAVHATASAVPLREGSSERPGRFAAARGSAASGIRR